MAFNRVPVTSVPLANFADGQILFGADVNVIVDVFKTAINANGQDLAVILSGDRDANVVTTFAALSLIEDPETEDQALVLNDEEQEGQTSLYNFNGTDWVLVYQISIAQMKDQLEGFIDGTTIAGKAAALDDGENNVVTAERAKIISDFFVGPANEGAAFGDVTVTNLIVRNQQGQTSTIDFADAVTLNATQAHINNTQNPHGVTKSDVNLAAVTNHAQVKKIESSTSGNVPTWDGTTGDLLNNGFGVQTTTPLTASTTQLARADVVKAYVDATTAIVDGKVTNIVNGTTNIQFAPGQSGLDSVNIKDAILEIYAEKGVAGGVATLDGNQRIPTSQLPTTAIEFKGTFGSAQSTRGGDLPTTGFTGDLFICDQNNFSSTAASKTFQSGDKALWDNTKWVRNAANDSVTSVEGVEHRANNPKIGNVTLNKEDIGLGNVANTAQVTAVTGTSPIVATEGTTPAISISAATTEAAGSMSAADKTKLDELTADTIQFDTPGFTGQLATDPETLTIQDALIVLDTHGHLSEDITDLDATKVPYDNTGQNLVATNVQTALNEIDDLVEEGLTVIQVVTYVVTDADDGTGGFTFTVNGGSPVTGGTITNGVYQFPLPAETEYTTGTNRLAVKIDASNGALKRLFFGADNELTEPNDTSFGIEFALADNDVVYAQLFQSLATVSIEVGDGSITQAKIANGAVNNNKLANNTVEFNKIQQIVGNRILGNDVAGTGEIKQLTAEETKVLLALNNVTNTSDANKPVSALQQTALNLKADKTNVLEKNNTTSFTPTADFEPATKKYVDDEVGGLELGLANIDGIGDVTITNVQDGEALVYDEATGDWINSQVSGVQNIDAGSSTTVFSVADINIDGGNA